MVVLLSIIVIRRADQRRLKRTRKCFFTFSFRVWLESQCWCWPAGWAKRTIYLSKMAPAVLAINNYGLCKWGANDPRDAFMLNVSGIHSPIYAVFRQVVKQQRIDFCKQSSKQEKFSFLAPAALPTDWISCRQVIYPTHLHQLVEFSVLMFPVSFFLSTKTWSLFCTWCVRGCSCRRRCLGRRILHRSEMINVIHFSCQCV